MVRKKICLLGSFAVGKTSLINQFVNESFSYKYETTIGVKIDKKSVTINNTDLELIIWDIHGHDQFQSVRPSYLMGCAGYFLVVDATRKNSLEVVPKLVDLVKKAVGNIPFFILINKDDLQSLHEIDIEDILSYNINKEDIIRTSAKTGSGVEEAFFKLGLKLLNEH
ncbi:MAG: Rab family GTPase [Draconibacterium sp.]